MNTSCDRKHHEISMVALAYAVTYPRAVVVMHFNTGVTIRTVERPRRLVNLAGSAHSYVDLFSFDFAVALLAMGRSRDARLNEFIVSILCFTYFIHLYSRL